MASPRDIDRNLRLHFQEFGAGGVINRVEALGKSITGVDLKFKGLGSSIKQTATGFGQIANSANYALGILNSLTRPLGGMNLSLMGIVKTNYDLAKSYRSVGAEFARFGIGYDQLTRRVNAYAVANRMLRTEVLSLASAINQGFKAAAPNFENIITLFKGMVGNNPQAIGQMISQVSGLAGQYAGIGRSITSISDKSGKLTESQKLSLEILTSAGEAAGTLDDQQNNFVQNLLASQQASSQFFSEADQKRKQELDNQINGYRTFEQTVERLQVTLGEQLMPVMVKISDFLQKWNSEIVDVAAGFAKWVAILAAVPGVLNIGVGSLKGLAYIGGRLAGTAAGAAGLGAGAGAGGTGTAVAAGGAALSAGALFATAAGGALAVAGLYGAAEHIANNNLGASYGSDSRKQYEFQRSRLLERAASASSTSEREAAEAAIRQNTYREQLRRSQEAKLHGFGNFFKNAWDGWTGTDRESDSEKTLRKSIAREQEIINKAAEDKRNDEAEKTKQAELDILGIKQHIFEIEKAGTPLRQQQREQVAIVKQNLESQRNLMQQQLGLLTTISEKVRMSGGIRFGGMAEVGASAAAARGELENTLRTGIEMQRILAGYAANTEKLRQQRRNIAEVERPGVRSDLDAVEASLPGLKSRATSDYLDDEGKKQALAEYDAAITSQYNLKRRLADLDKDDIDLLKVINEQNSAIAENKQKINEYARNAVAIAREQTTANDDLIQRQESLTSLAEAQVSLADNLAMGLAASAKMRMQAVQQIEGTITLLSQKMGLIDDQQSLQMATQAKATKDLAEARAKGDEQAAQFAEQQLAGANAAVLQLDIDRLNVSNQIVQKKQQEAQMLRALRDGYISAISAMNTGAGVFTKIIIDQNKGMGTLLRSTGAVPTALRTGSDVGGFRTFERFTAGGIAGSAERSMFPIVRPEWQNRMNPMVRFPGLGPGASLSDAAGLVSGTITERMRGMSANMAAGGANATNISRTLDDPATKREIAKIVNTYSDPGAGWRNYRNRFAPGTDSVLTDEQRKEVSESVKGLVKTLIDSFSAAKQDILAEIHKGLG